MRRLLVTGGAGFIGANFVAYWLEQHPGSRLVVLDALTYAGNLANLRAVESHPEFRFVHGSICDTGLVEQLLRDERLDTLVNFAAESHVDRSIASPGAFIETNVVGTHSLLMAARRIWLDAKASVSHRFHHVSTDEVFGSLDHDAPSFTEESPYAPSSPYAASKAASDHIVRAYHRTYGLNTTITNCSNNYGRYQLPEKLIPLTMLNALRGQPLPVYGDGLHIRDWMHVSDHCRAVDLALSKGRIGASYNVGGLSERHNHDVVRMICDQVDDLLAARPDLRLKFANSPAAQGRATDSLIRFVKDRPGHDRRYAIDCRLAQTELGYTPTVELESGLRGTLEWLVNNEWWWRHSHNEHDRWMAAHYGAERAQE